MSSLIPAVGGMFSRCLEFVYTIFEETGMLSFYFAVVVILLVVSYLLSPVLVPVSGSDVSSRKSYGYGNRYRSSRKSSDSGNSSPSSSGNS